MNQCPVCQTEIQDAFGIVQCPECKTMLVAEFDGTLKVHLETSEEASEVSIAEAQGTPALQVGSVEESFESPQSSSEQLPSWDAELPKEESIETLSEKSHPVIREINKFGGSDDSKLEEGDLIYKLTFSEIHDLDIQSEILEYLKEKRLALEEKQIQITKDKVVIDSLNPVKLSVIISKTKGLPVEIRWEQQTLLG